MKRNLLLYILLIFLIVANVFFLFNYLSNTNNENEKRPPRPAAFIVKELQFNKSQLKEFRGFNREHRKKMRHISRGIKKLKDTLFSRLSDALIDQEVIDSITALIGEGVKERDIEVFYHFKKIQEICNDSQKVKFKKIIKDALHLGGRRRGRPPHGNEERRRPPHHK